MRGCEGARVYCDVNILPTVTLLISSISTLPRFTFIFRASLQASSAAVPEEKTPVDLRLVLGWSRIKSEGVCWGGLDLVSDPGH